jgi:hypothetical protein
VNQEGSVRSHSKDRNMQEIAHHEVLLEVVIAFTSKVPASPIEITSCLLLRGALSFPVDKIEMSATVRLPPTRRSATHQPPASTLAASSSTSLHWKIFIG